MDHITIRELADELNEMVATGQGNLIVVTDENNVTEPMEFVTIRNLFEAVFFERAGIGMPQTLTAQEDD